MGNINEAGVIFHRQGGHDHDGVNSTKIDFTYYTEEELAPILDKVKDSSSTVILSSGGSSSGVASSDSIFFHQSGAVALSPSVVAEKKIKYASTSINIIATLGAAGSTETVVTIYKNGVSIGDIHIPANAGHNSPVETSIMSAFNGTTDVVSARVTAAGTSAQELGVEITAIPA